MDDIPEYDLLNLDDNVFKVEEVIFENENELFNIGSFLDKYMRSNPTAKADGVFRGRLHESIQGSGSDIQHFWSMLENSPKAYLTSQCLKAPDQLKSFSMEHQSVKIHKCTEFFNSLRRPDTLNYPQLNCCTTALQIGGPKAAVKHFYDTLQSKALRAEKFQLNSNCTNSGGNYKARQRLLEGLDPALNCARIEASMRSKTYNVMDTPAISDNDSSCKCHRCHLDVQASNMSPQQEMFDAYGNSDTCSLYFTDIEETNDHFLYITRNFSLAHLCHLNMLTDLKSYYPGVSFPYVYLGGHHSFFPMHVEDMSLWSINVHHKGDPKFFIVVAPCHALKLSRVLGYYGLSNIHRTCIYKLGHKSSVVFPQLLLHHKISFKITIQKPGDFLFLAPNAAHTGGNMGVNMAQACNIATEDWLPYGSVAQHHNCNCIENGVHLDVTPLIKKHRPDLLKSHLKKCMHVEFADEHFQNSIIVPHLASEQQARSVPDLVTPTVQPANSLTTRKRSACSRSPLACPITGCFKEYKVPNKKTLLQHINLRHSKIAASKKTLKAVDALFPKKGSLRKTCEDCGIDISVYSNKHRGSSKCLLNQKKKLGVKQQGSLDVMDDSQDGDIDNGSEDGDGDDD